MRIRQVAPKLLAIAAVCSFAAEPAGEWLQELQSANILVNKGDFDGAEALYRRALLQAETAADNLRVAVVMQNLGILLYRRGDSLAAEKAYLRAINALKDNEAGDDRLMRRTYVALSSLYLRTGRHPKAEPLIRRLLAEDSATAADKVSLMGSLGVILAQKQQFADAEQVLRDTSELCEGATETELQEAGAVAIANMAGIQMNSGRTTEAVESYQRALAIMETLPNSSPVSLAVTFGEYAGVRREMGDLDTAEGLYRKGIAVAEARLGPNHAVLGGLLQQYSDLLRAEGRKSEAGSLANAAQRIRNESKGQNPARHTVSIEELSSNR